MTDTSTPDGPAGPDPAGTVRHFPVQAGHIQVFAEAIGDTSPAFKADAPGPVVAPPTFTIASAHFDRAYPLRPRIGEPWFGSGATPSGATRDPGESASSGGDGPALGPVLHAEQHYEIHRPVVAGDVLSSVTKPGKTWEKTGRSGRLLFSEMVTEFRDQSGELVVTATTVGVRTEMGTGA